MKIIHIFIFLIFIISSMEDNNTYYFYDLENEFVSKDHLFLNNFDPSPFKADDFIYPAVEHYYQAHKFDNFEENPAYKAIFEEIR